MTKLIIGAFFIFIILAILTDGFHRCRSSEMAKINMCQTELHALKIAYRRYQSTYNKPPKNLEAMLSTSPENPRKQVFFDCDQIPVDLYSETPYKIIPHVKEVTQTTNYKITAYTTDPAAQNLIIYSVGKNSQDDHGLFDPDTDKDDIALFIRY